MGPRLSCRSLALAPLLLSCLAPVHADITVYTAKTGQVVFGPTTTAPPSGWPSNTALAYNTETLVPPTPTPGVMTQIPVQLQNSGTTGMSITQSGAFFGFSIEMSVSNQLLGKNSTLIQVPFLNLMSSVRARGGSVRIRVGGNSQETAKLVPLGSLDNGRIIEKNLTGATGPTSTPPLEFTDDLLYMMNNISTLVGNINYIIGVPWADVNPFDLKIVASGLNILGDKLIGLQCGNEPDLYIRHGRRVQPYGPQDYFNEVGSFLSSLVSEGVDPNGRAKSLVVAPNVNSGDWTPEMVWDTGFLDTYSANLAFMAVEKYPLSNCGAMIHDGEPILDPQATFSQYLSHNISVNTIAMYLPSTALAQQKGKRMLLMETNQASCGGIQGISNTFGAALWGIDYALQLAHSNFSGAFFHSGGQSVFYNPFTAPPTNETKFHSWSVGPLYYSSLVVAETIGPSDNAQVMNLPIAGLSDQTPVFAIYENGTPVRVAAVNYLNDPTGASDISLTISIAGGTIPGEVKVKYLAASSVSQMGGYTWANQTLGGYFSSDGRLQGNENVQTVPCDTTAGTCVVKVPAPGFALVSLDGNIYSEAETSSTLTFPTTTGHHKTGINTLLYPDATALSTSNGHNNSVNALLGSTDKAGLTLKAGALRTTAFAGTVLAGIAAGVARLLL